MSESLPDNPIKGVGKKVGPLPLYAYALIIVVCAYGVYWWKNNKVGVAQPEGATDIGSGFSPTAPSPFPSAGGYNGSVTTTPNAGASSKTNAQWAKNTADSLIASGSNPADVNNAISAYLSGGTLNSVWSAIIATALRLYGNPPEGIVAVKVEPVKDVALKDRFVKFLSFKGDPSLYGITPSGEQVGVTYAQWAALGFPKYETIDGPSGIAPRTTQTQYTMYTVQPVDTLERIAQGFFGTSDGSAITSANPGVAITPGTVLKVPVK